MKRRLYAFALLLVLCSAVFSQALADNGLYDQFQPEWADFPTQRSSSYQTKPTRALQTILYYYTSTTRTPIANAGGMDGSYGSGTTQAVTNFQTIRGLSSIDGICGGGTWDSLYKILTHNVGEPDENQYNTSTAYKFGQTYPGSSEVLTIKRDRREDYKVWYRNINNQIFCTLS